MARALPLIFAAGLFAASGCWDTIDHVYDRDDDAQKDKDASPVGGYEFPPEGWDGFGEACEQHSDCEGYPGERRCLRDVLGLINSPEGYCSACCDEPGPDVCAPGIDCVGDTGVYLICIMHCNSDADCRTEDGYICREIYYVPDDFPGTYCVPKPELSKPSKDDHLDVDCPWPW